MRKGGDEVMGEADDTVSSLDADISDWMERRVRLVELEGSTKVKSERRGVGYRVFSSGGCAVSKSGKPYN